MSATFVTLLGFLKQRPRVSESYRKTVKVDGELCNVCVAVSGIFQTLLLMSSRQPQLEVLDTAGADQFTSMNEWYIKVRWS